MTDFDAFDRDDTELKLAALHGKLAHIRVTYAVTPDRPKAYRHDHLGIVEGFFIQRRKRGGDILSDYTVSLGGGRAATWDDTDTVEIMPVGTMNPR